MVTILVMSLISVLCTSLTLQSKADFLADICTVISAFLVWNYSVAPKHSFIWCVVYLNLHVLPNLFYSGMKGTLKDVISL